VSEFQDRRRTGAAFGGLQFRALLLIGERRGAAVNDPDMIVGIDKDADGLSEHPMIGHRLRPHRIDFEARRLHCGLRGGGCLVEHRLADAERRKDRNKPATQ